jgi:hypothetical protein
MWNITFNGKCKLTTEEMEDEEAEEETSQEKKE